MFHPKEPTDDEYLQLAKSAYQDTPLIPGWTILAQTDTLKIFSRDQVIVISFRGTTGIHDLKTNIMVALNNLSQDKRYISDKKFIEGFLEKNPQTIYVTGHSLGGAIATQLAQSIPRIQGGLVFNAAFQLNQMISKSKVRRIYHCDDVICHIGGRALDNVTVIGMRGQKKIKQAHSLDVFESTFKNIKAKWQIARHLVNQSIRSTVRSTIRSTIRSTVQELDLLFNQLN